MQWFGKGHADKLTHNVIIEKKIIPKQIIVLAVTVVSEDLWLCEDECAKMDVYSWNTACKSG